MGFNMINIKGHTFDKKELSLGIPIELEHTKSKKVAERIAKQHLVEYKNYYSQGVIPMEKKLKAMNMREKSNIKKKLKTVIIDADELVAKEAGAWN